MHRYWMETTNLAPLHYLDPSLPSRSLGRRYVWKRRFNKQWSQGWANNSVFGLAAGLKNNTIEQQINRCLLWTEPNVSIFVILTESNIFSIWCEKKSSFWALERKVKATKGYMNNLTKSMLPSMRAAQDDDAHFPLLIQSSVCAFVC